MTPPHPPASPAVVSLAEQRRLAALNRLRILDTPPERDFDDLVILASQIFDTPIALVSLVDRDRQWFKARIGLDVEETERSIAFCAKAIEDPTSVFVVEDASTDPRYASNPLVVGPLGVRFYAGAPIVSADGAPVGTVCVIDTKRGVLDPLKRRCLEALARQAATMMEVRYEALQAVESEGRLLDLNEQLERDIDLRTLERNHRQTALEAAEAALRQSQKMEALGQLTGGLAHDFNNLLTGITGSLELLQLRVSQGRLGELDRYLGVARTATGRAAALTHRLLAFARRQTLDPKATDVDRLIAEMVDLIQQTVGPEITLRLAGRPAATDPLWTAMVDASQLDNVLLNLCINARDAMPHGGDLTIVATNLAVARGAARANDLQPGEYLSIAVTDTGTGMTDEVMKRAFDPFFTTKPLGLGTGLGLSMVYGFARQSGGQVRIDSAIGIGTTVTLLLPRFAGSAAEIVDMSTRSSLTGILRDEKVLIVDDDAAVRMLIGEVLGDLGYTSMEAEDGAAGLTLLRTDPEVDLLITDVGLPGGLNGRQVADAARVLRPGLKVLFITGYAESVVLGSDTLDAGMQILTKPFSLEALATKIADMLPERGGRTAPHTDGASVARQFAGVTSSAHTLKPAR